MLIVKQPQGFVISQTLNHKNNNNKISMVKQYLRCDIFSNFTLFSHKYIYFNVTHNYKKKVKMRYWSHIDHLHVTHFCIILISCKFQ